MFSNSFLPWIKTQRSRAQQSAMVSKSLTVSFRETSADVILYNMQLWNVGLRIFEELKARKYESDGMLKEWNRQMFDQHTDLPALHLYFLIPHEDYFHKKRKGGQKLHWRRRRMRKKTTKVGNNCIYQPAISKVSTAFAWKLQST